MPFYSRGKSLRQIHNYDEPAYQSRKEEIENIKAILRRFDKIWSPKLHVAFYRNAEGCWVEILEDKLSETQLFRALNRKRGEVLSDPLRLLRSRRKALGFTLDDLEERTGIDRANLSKIEKGQRPLGKVSALRLAKALQIDPVRLGVPISGTESP
jgi:hypothetical protein